MAGNPILGPRPESTFTDPITGQLMHWEALHAFNPTAIVRNGHLFVLYRAEDDSGTMNVGGHTSRLGLAESADGSTWTRLPAPVFYPDKDDQQDREWPGGTEDPRLVESEDGTYVLTYTQWNHKSIQVGIATSRDLLHWNKQGPAFGTTGPWATLHYKSAGIVTELKHGRLIAAKVDGHYLMYWGEGAIHLATSPDLVHWTPVEESDHKPLVILKPRPLHFDSSFPEAGPPPILTKAGIVLLYNGRNASAGKPGDPNLGPSAYAAGEALFDRKDPTKLLAQTEDPVLQPEEPYEKTGQYAAGTTFAEGLVVFHKQWFLFYGCADSFVAYVTAPMKK